MLSSSLSSNYSLYIVNHSFMNQGLPFVLGIIGVVYKLQYKVLSIYTINADRVTADLETQFLG